MEEEKIPLIEPEAAARIPCRVPRRPKRVGALSGRIRMTLALGLCMAALGLILYTIVVSRAQSRTDVIFGGADAVCTSLRYNAPPSGQRPDDRFAYC